MGSKRRIFLFITILCLILVLSCAKKSEADTDAPSVADCIVPVESFAEYGIVLPSDITERVKIKQSNFLGSERLEYQVQVPGLFIHEHILADFNPLNSKMQGNIFTGTFDRMIAMTGMQIEDSGLVVSQDIESAVLFLKQEDGSVKGTLVRLSTPHISAAYTFVGIVIQDQEPLDEIFQPVVAALFALENRKKAPLRSARGLFNRKKAGADADN